MHTAENPQLKKLESQLTALRFALQKALSGEAKSSNIFALKGKISKLEKQISDVKNFDWLSQ